MIKNRLICFNFKGKFKNVIEKVEIIRPLSQIEESFTLINLFYPMTVVCVIKLDKSPPEDIVRFSTDNLQLTNPLLKAYIKKFNNRYFFVRDDQKRKISISVINRNNDNQWEDIVRAELNSGFDPGQSPLMKVHYLNSPDFNQPSEVTLSFHHAITDSASIVYIIKQLLTIIDTRITNPEYSVSELSLTDHKMPLLSDIIPLKYKGSRILFHLIPFIFRQIWDEIRYKLSSRTTSDKPIPDSSENDLLTISFTESETNDLVKWSRGRRLTINSIITAAMLSAVNDHNYQNNKKWLRTVQFANLRPYLKPPVTDNIPGAYVALTRFSVPFNKGDHIADIAAYLDRRMIKSSGRGEKFLYAALSNKLVKSTIRAYNSRLGSTALSYSGAVSLKDKYDTFSVKDIHAYITNNSLGAEFTAFGKIFSGRLSLDCNYLTKEMAREEAAELALSIKSLLLELKKEV
jgi:hypothetical protein